MSTDRERPRPNKARRENPWMKRAFEEAAAGWLVLAERGLTGKGRASPMARRDPIAGQAPCVCRAHWPRHGSGRVLFFSLPMAICPRVRVEFCIVFEARP